MRHATVLLLAALVVGCQPTSAGPPVESSTPPDTSTWVEPRTATGLCDSHCYGIATLDDKGVASVKDKCLYMGGTPDCWTTHAAVSCAIGDGEIQFTGDPGDRIGWCQQIPMTTHGVLQGPGDYPPALDHPNVVEHEIGDGWPKAVYTCTAVSAATTATVQWLSCPKGSVRLPSGMDACL